MNLDRCFRSLILSLVLVFTAWSLAFAAPPLPAAAPESVGMSTQRLAKLHGALQGAIDDGAFPGAVVMVARKGKLVYSETLGALTPGGKKMPEDALFRIYSMTKPLVSLAAMMLVEDGKIELTDPVGKFLPGFDKMQVSVENKDTATGISYELVPNERAMTVQDLLRHSSGFAYTNTTKNAASIKGYEENAIFVKDIPGESRLQTPAEQIAALVKVPLIYQPGTVWNYGFSTDVLGRVVEVASGKRLGDFLRERIFVPLKMNDTGFRVAADKVARLAEPLPKDKTSGQPNTMLDMTIEPKNDSGGAGGVSSASDYLRFSQMLLNGGALEGQRLVSRNTIQLMASDHLGSTIATPLQPGELLLGVKGYTFGLGFAVRKEDGIAAVPGSAGEFTWGGYGGTYFWVDPKEQLTAVFMTQAPSPSRAYYRRMVRALVYQAISD
jgi:CubicO group peptidase (beta-lactamase class C family)